jgi:hypothetical protein
MLSYYVYYRVPPENANRARAAVEAMQRELAATCGVSGRLLRRRDDESTWMEIYDNVSDRSDFEERLGGLVVRHALERLLVSGSSRKLEIFRDF